MKEQDPPSWPCTFSNGKEYGRRSQALESEDSGFHNKKSREIIGAGVRKSVSRGGEGRSFFLWKQNEGVTVTRIVGLE